LYNRRLSHISPVSSNITCTNYLQGKSAQEKEKKSRAAIGTSVSDFIFLASAYEGWWQVLSLTVSYSHRQCMTLSGAQSSG